MISMSCGGSWRTPIDYNMTRCSLLGCTRDAVVREAWYDDPEDVPSFCSGEVAWCAEHAEKHASSYQ